MQLGSLSPYSGHTLARQSIGNVNSSAVQKLVSKRVDEIANSGVLTLEDVLAKKVRNSGTLTVTGSCDIASINNTGTVNISDSKIESLMNSGTSKVKNSKIESWKAYGSSSAFASNINRLEVQGSFDLKQSTVTDMLFLSSPSVAKIVDSHIDTIQVCEDKSETSFCSNGIIFGDSVTFSGNCVFTKHVTGGMMITNFGSNNTISIGEVGNKFSMEMKEPVLTLINSQVKQVRFESGKGKVELQGDSQVGELIGGSYSAITSS